MSPFFPRAIKVLIALLLLASSASTQIDWSLSANFIAADAAGGPHLGLAHCIVRDIQEDGKGRMWFSTQKGVSCLNGKTFKSYLNSPTDKMLWKDWGCHFLTADGKGRIWLATTFKLFYFDEFSDRFVEYDLTDIEPEAPKGLGTSEIYLQDWPESGEVWFHKWAGLYAIDGRALTIRKALSLPRKVGVTGRDNDGLVWEGGWGSKEIHLLRPDGTAQQKKVSPMNHIRDIFQEPGTSRVWVGTDILLSFDKKTGNWERWNDQRNLLGYLEGMTLVPKLTSDSIMWLYSITGPTIFGFHLKHRKFVWQHSTEPVDGNSIRCGGLQRLFVDSNGNAWLSGLRGVSVIFSDRRQAAFWSVLAKKTDLTAVKRANSTVVGTWKMPDGSLAEWVNHGGEHWYIALSERSKAYFEGRTQGGSIEGVRTRIDLETGARTVSKMVYRVDEQGNWSESEPGKTGGRPMVEQLLFENNIVICNGSRTEGADDLSGTWKCHNSLFYCFQDGDFSAMVSALQVQKCKKTGPQHWKGQLITFNDGRTEFLIEQEVVRKDSILCNWTALGSNRDVEKGQIGNSFSKKYSDKAMSSDSVFITQFRIFDEIQSLLPSDFREQELVIGHEQNFISFDFSSSTDVATTTFYYRLEGFDKGWFQARMQRTVTYTNLHGGSYIFRVRATDAEGNELIGKAQFRLAVRPPLYQTWWFICLAAVVFFGLVWMIFHYRLRQRLEKEAIRHRIARDLHDEVGSSLSAISILSASTLHGVQKDLDAARFGNIGDKARAALDSISDIVWSVNPENDSMEKALARMGAYASEMLENVGTELRFEVGAGVESLTLPMEKRKDFYLIFKEAVHNCAKYARAKRVVVALRKEGNTLIMSVKDDGVGFEISNAEAKNLGGNGLRNMQSRAAALGGRLEVVSAPGAGTEVRLVLPL